MEKSFLIYVFLIYVNFSEKQIGRKARDGCVCVPEDDVITIL